MDRHVEAGRGDKVAFHWVGEPEGDTRDLTYAELQGRGLPGRQRADRARRRSKGDRVAIYMPMIPETVVAMLACARLGAPHTVVFGGFSADALASRIVDCEAKVVITSDGGYRRGAAVGAEAGRRRGLREGRPAARRCETVLVVRRTGQDVDWDDGRDVWWHDARRHASRPSTTAELLDSEHPLYVMYTSGTTGKPKGILHTTGGYLVGTSYTHWAVFDLKPETDVYWCTADVGWVTGHSYMVYGPLANGATQVMYEGTPDTPHKGRWWEIIEKYGVTIFYTAPTAIRTFMKWGNDIPAEFDLSSLRLLGSVGEPINPEAYVWYREHIGGDRAPVVDTWWQTETGQIMISPLPGVTARQAGLGDDRRCRASSADVVDDEARVGAQRRRRLPRAHASRGRRCCAPSGATTSGSRTPTGRAGEGLYFAGDGAKKDEDGDLWLLGRVDDVMNVSGPPAVHHRDRVRAGLAPEGRRGGRRRRRRRDDRPGGRARSSSCASPAGRRRRATSSQELRNHVAKEIGPIAKPRQMMIVPELPKTRSGKIMRRLLKDIAEHREVGDVTTLADSTVMDLIKTKEGGSASEE